MPPAPDSAQALRAIHAIDRISAFVGKAFAWLIGALMVLICLEVVKRYFFNEPSSLVFDASAMLYGAAFMMCGAYTLAQNAHVRGDFLYGSMRPRTQAALDLVLYFLFFVPGILALCFAGWGYAHDSWAIAEHSNTTADGMPVYHFKTLIPIAGALVALQGFAEIARCVICLRSGRWPPRLKDVAETDVVEQQLARSEHVDADAKRQAIGGLEAIETAAHARARGNRQ